MWFRRDLRVTDNPALSEAAQSGKVLGLFVLDPALVRQSGAPRLAVLYRTLRALDQQLDGRLLIRRGKPQDVLPAVVAEFRVDSVHCAADFGPYGGQRDRAVEQALAVPMVRTGSAYAVDPGRVNRVGDHGYQVYSAFYRSWLDHGWPEPRRVPRFEWTCGIGDDIPADPRLSARLSLPKVGEYAARAAWRGFLRNGIDHYAKQRDRPDLDGTSRMSVHLKWGTIHPRTLLTELRPEHDSYRRELAWREFYADVLHRRPDSAREYYRPELRALRWSRGAIADAHLEAWAQGRTGYPIVDAGMRQLLAEGWMHNRVRMIVASFLVKDLHIEWMAGAQHFLNHLIDGDLASNNHGWQWVAGCGTDAAPYFRIFNPILQGKKFDPDGAYVRRYVPELRDVAASVIHEPWRDRSGVRRGYPDPIVDHAAERKAALADYRSIRGQ